MKQQDPALEFSGSDPVHLAALADGALLQPSTDHSHEGVCVVEHSTGEENAESPCSNLTLLVSDRYAKEVMRVRTDSNGAFRLPASFDRATVVMDSTAASLEVERVEVPKDSQAAEGVVLHLVDTGDR